MAHSPLNYVRTRSIAPKEQPPDISSENAATPLGPSSAHADAPPRRRPCTGPCIAPAGVSVRGRHESRPAQPRTATLSASSAVTPGWTPGRPQAPRYAYVTFEQAYLIFHLHRHIFPAALPHPRRQTTTSSSRAPHPLPRGRVPCRATLLAGRQPDHHAARWRARVRTHAGAHTQRSTRARRFPFKKNPTGPHHLAYSRVTHKDALAALGCN